MMTKEFEWPKELIVMLRREHTRLIFLRLVYYVSQAKVYIDEERNLYRPTKTKREEGVIIDLELRRNPDSDVEVGMPVSKDHDFSGMFSGMFGKEEQGPKPIRLSEYKGLEGFQTVFRTAEAAHKEWYKLLKQEQEVIVGQLDLLDEWFDENDMPHSK
jgi:hypothetical protein